MGLHVVSFFCFPSLVAGIKGVIFNGDPLN